MPDRPYIDQMNPVVKIWVLTLIALVASLDYKPFVTSLLFLVGLILAQTASSVSALEILRAIRGFLLLCAGFILVIVTTRYLSGEPLAILAVFSLGFRIILISSYSALFIKTTDPTEFVLALIHYFRMPVTMGYAFLTAYRFLPSFREEMDTIRYAHQVRGIEESRNPLVRVWNVKRYVIPMMAGAVRKGIRISMAMETRAFGKYPDRTYYRTLVLPAHEVVSGIGFTLFVVLILGLLTGMGLTQLGFIYQS